MRHWDAELDELIVGRGRALVGYAYVLCGNRDDAEDLVQEALVRVFSRWRHLPRPEAPADGTVPVDTTGAGTESYVRTTILNLYVDGYRRRRRFAGVRHVLVDDVARGPASGAVVRADVAAALGSLSPRQRACVVLRYFEDLTVPQVAAALGIADGTAKRHLHDAMGVLRGVLGAPPGAPPPGDPPGGSRTASPRTTARRKEVA